MKMQRQDVNRGAGACALSLVVALSFFAVPAQAAPFTNVYVFGDSDSDNGNRFALEGIPVPPYYMGRHSNGPVEVEVLANNLGATLHDFAVGGAFSGHGNLDPNPVLDNTGVLDQVGAYIAGLGAGSADPDALYIIGGGGNDFAQYGQTSTTAQTIIANEETDISDLEAAGAVHFLVWTRGNYGVGFGNLLTLDLDNFAAVNNYDVTVYNAVPLINEMLDPVDNPFGFTHFAGDPCFTGTLASGLTGGATVCPDPQDYVFWDTNNHLTARGYQILGDAMTEVVVPEPPGIAIFAAGLAALGIGAFLRRTRTPYPRALVAAGYDGPKLLGVERGEPI